MQHSDGANEALVRDEHRLQCCSGLTGRACHRRARGVRLRVGVDGFLAVVRHVVDEAADQRLGDQTRGGDDAVDDLHYGRLLH